MTTTATTTATVTLSVIVRQIITTRQALKKRLTELAAPVAAAIQAADNADGKAEKAAARKAINQTHKAFLLALGSEATEAFNTAKQLAADAAAIADAAGEDETAAAWDWHKGSEGRKARNALNYMFKCIREDTGLDLSFDEKTGRYIASVAPAKTDGKKNAAPKVSAETDGRTVVANQAAANQAAADETASAADDASNEAKAAALLDSMIKTNREAVLLALAATYPDRDSMIEAVMMIPAGSFPAVSTLTVMAG